MFVSQAHSFTQQARLAITLAWVAGYTNVVTVLACGQVVSHLSGTTTGLGRDVGEGAWSLASYAFFLLGTFCAGACISGWATEWGRRRGFESIYVLPMMLETALLFLVALGTAAYGPDLQLRGWELPLYGLIGLASCAMGLQNATISRISNGDVRTTHVTGVVTDLGLEINQLLWLVCQRGPTQESPTQTRQQCFRRLGLLASIIGSFALGAGLGTWGYEHYPQWAMFAPVAFLVWIIYQDLVRPIAEIEPVDLASQTSGLQLPSSLAVYHLGGELGARSRQRMPNLLAWADRLPAATRVVILDLHEAVRLNENAVLDLSALLARLDGEGRELIVAGLGTELYKQLQAIDADRFAALDHVCPDLELAIARGLVRAKELGADDDGLRVA